MSAWLLLRLAGARGQAGRLRTVFWFVYVVIGAMVGLYAPGGDHLLPLSAVARPRRTIAQRWWAPAERVGAILAIVFLYLSWGGMLALLEELLNQGPMWVFAPLGALILLPVLIEASR